ncbi:2'-5' RNA ligase family protein [Hymenobacter convexus]|uniref:2'-5' RNA ligase family protein n=1 Tax=Hymenobacter sp. CA1UV-4 TaxID=3063782 RepID=UPI0027132F76|nr:2'-5' RNA ligase family protein [Hymenobacter sp. CA1UV-4]MDO7850252.1 2'-5' RNA ligase family protein [Hymenobacter sp. CA1UV-4]
MNLEAHYDAMREAALCRLAQGDADLDPLLDAADDRRGITLLARPPGHVIREMEAVLADFRSAEPGQYYYPASDIHLTILSIISCYRGFGLELIDPAAYSAAVQDIVRHCRPFRIRFTGLTASPGGIMVQGVPEDDTLNRLRDELRSFFRNAGLQQSIDQRYSIQTAHSTVLRFRRPLQNPARLLEKIRQYQAHSFGTFEVDALELVFNDWYQRAGNTVLLERYPLLNPG